LRTYLQEKAAGVRAEAPEDLTTSDVQQELEDMVNDAQAIADFPIEVNLRIYINKTIAKRENLPDSSRDTLDLSIVEEALLEELETLVQGEISNIYRTTIVRANTSKGTNKIHDLDDFSFSETERVLGMVNAAREQHPRSKIAITIEVKLSVELPKPNPHKRKASDTDPENSSPIPSSPPVIIEKKKSTQTSNLAKQQAGDFERQLTDKYIYRDKGCTNQDAYCYPDPRDPYTHCSITAVQQKTWAQCISTGECTIQQPPMKLWMYWVSDQGPITRDSKASDRKTFQQQTKDSLESLQEQVERSRLQSQLLAEQERLTQHAERQEERQYRREEREEERQARQEEQEAEHRRRRDIEDRQRQQRQQEGEYRQLTYNIYPFPRQSPTPYLQNGPLFPLPPLYPHTAIPSLGSLSFDPPQSQLQLESSHASRKSSPISSELDDS
jgi:hypothetical protein